jgi:hypothetical protein
VQTHAIVTTSFGITNSFTDSYSPASVTALLNSISELARARCGFAALRTPCAAAPR